MGNYWLHFQYVLLFAFITGTLFFGHQALAESEQITITNINYDETISSFSVSANLENFDTSGVLQILLIVYDPNGFSSSELISLSSDSSDFEVITPDLRGFVMIESVTIDVDVVSIDAFVLGIDSTDAKVGLFLQNESNNNVLDFSSIDSESSNDDNLSCEQLTELIDSSMIPSEIGEALLAKSGC